MRTRYLFVLRLVLFVTDLLLLNIAFFTAAMFVGTQGSLIDFAKDNNLAVVNLIWVVSTLTFRLYSEQTTSRLESIFRCTWRSIVFHLVIYMFFIVFANKDDVARDFIILFYIQTGFLFLASRFIGTYLEGLMLDRFRLKRPVAVLGKNKTGLRLASYFAENKTEYDFTGFIGENDGLYVDEKGELLASACEGLKTAAEKGVKEVYVSLSPDRMVEVDSLVMEAEKQCVRLKLVPDLTDSIGNPYSFSFMGDFPVINLRKEPLEDIGNRFRKRLFDLVFSSLVIVFVLSWLYPIIALLIKIQSRGPVLFRQERTGRDNKPFLCLKFRSMRMNNDSDKRQAGKNDDRVTPIGRFLRKSSLDELPQFLNVFLGDMSVIGPRPHMLQHTEQYKALIDRYMVRQFLKPGISGWAQVNGFRGETKEQSLMEARVKHDIWYMENWSSMLDVRIIFMTVINMIKGEENAY